MDRKRFGRKMSWNDRSTVSEFALERPRKTVKAVLFRRYDGPTEIRVEVLQNKKDIPACSAFLDSNTL
jgi:hypothetical protein